MTLITKLANIASAHCDNTIVAAAAVNNKTVSTQLGPSTLPLPVITREHPFVKLLLLLISKTSCNGKHLSHQAPLITQQNLNMQERCHCYMVCKANNSNINTNKKNDFTIM